MSFRRVMKFSILPPQVAQLRPRSLKEHRDIEKYHPPPQVKSEEDGESSLRQRPAFASMRVITMKISTGAVDKKAEIKASIIRYQFSCE